MRLRLGRFGWVTATVLLMACGGERTHSARPDDGGGGDGGSPDAGSGLAWFQPVRRAQPTEQGAWVVAPDDPLTLYALGQRSMRSRDGGRTWSELDWPEGAQALGFSRTKVATLLLRVGDPSGATGGKLLESPDDGESWTDTGAVVSPADEVIVVAREDGLVLLTWRDGELLRSSDKGSTWSGTVLQAEPKPIYSK